MVAVGTVPCILHQTDIRSRSKYLEGSPFSIAFSFATVHGWKLRLDASNVGGLQHR